MLTPATLAKRISPTCSIIGTDPLSDPPTCSLSRSFPDRLSNLRDWISLYTPSPATGRDRRTGPEGGGIAWEPYWRWVDLVMVLVVRFSRHWCRKNQISSVGRPSERTVLFSPGSAQEWQSPSTRAIRALPSRGAASDLTQIVPIHANKHSSQR